MSFYVLVAFGFLLMLPLAARADDTADGRRHAQRASQLAAKGKCKQAIGEYDKAIAVLHDPALLFNRGECHRKLGNRESALEDYNQFLADLPTAPNRAQVESRIAELKKAGPTSAAAVAPPPVPSGAGTPPATPSASAKADPRKPSGESAGAAGPTTLSGGGSVPDTIRVSAGAPGAADSAGGSDPLLLSNQESSQQPPPSKTPSDSLVGRPWFWIAVGAVVVGAGIGAYAVLSRDGTSIPPSELGNYKF